MHRTTHQGGTVKAKANTAKLDLLALQLAAATGTTLDQAQAAVARAAN